MQEKMTSRDFIMNRFGRPSSIGDIPRMFVLITELKNRIVSL